MSTRRKWLYLAGALGLLTVIAVSAVLFEVRDSRLQAMIFTRLARDFEYHLEEGPSERIVFPESGPYDERLGYTRIPELVHRLDSVGFDLLRQVRISPQLARSIELGAYPVYREKNRAGLTVLDRNGQVVAESRHPVRVYPAFDSIPEIVWKTLLFIESRDFLDSRYRRQNPAVEWDRLARGVGELGLRMLGADRNVPGGSTLATQIEKFRHSPEGRTRTPRDKLRQMATASLRAYRGGPDTFDERRRIVTTYLNSVPLAAQLDHGEVMGTADGLWAWYGTDFDDANAVLRSEPVDSAGRARKGEVYRQALSLLVAHRRPSFYLASAQGRNELSALVDRYVEMLRAAAVIPDWLAEAACAPGDHTAILDQAPERPPLSFAERKAANHVRSALLSRTGARSLYELDRLDMTATSTLDMAWHEAVTEVLRSLKDEDFLRANGFGETRLLDTGDPGGVLYSVTIMEHTPDGVAVRVQTDNFDGPLNLSNASRLELGSTAKLRTLVTYLEIVDELYTELSGVPVDSLGNRDVPQADLLTRWARDFMLEQPTASREELLHAAMLRTYSASPSERFVTGGGVQTFSNFDSQFDRRVLTVAEAFRQSVNLPFVRLMRDLAAYETYHSGAGRVLQDESDPARIDYLRRFADVEGASFVRQFFRKYDGRTGPEVFEALAEERRLGHQKLAWAFRTVAPDAPETLFQEFVLQHAPQDLLSDAAIAELFQRSDPSAYTLSDLGYLSGIHPLELWVASYVLKNPGTNQAAVLEASREPRIEVYDWLFRTRRRDAQDARIRTVLEIEAFQSILSRWRRVGYPFENIVPSVGTAIGSSGDRPLALAELVGIVSSGGIRVPVVSLDEIRLAEGTPYETHLWRRSAQGERVLGQEVAAVVREAMVDVVENGTGRRARGSFVASDGTALTLGGKTGTGDNRFRVFAPGGRETESRVVSRTATFVFIAGDRYFGVVTAYVPGRDAETYRFTSALPAQILRVVGGKLEGLSAPVVTTESQPSSAR